MTFWRAQERARAAGGKLILRIEDLDGSRCRAEFRDAIAEDLNWFGLEWDEGPYFQSERPDLYLATLNKLRAGGFVYPCKCSRKDVAAASLAPHDEDEEPIYPGTCRPDKTVVSVVTAENRVPPAAATEGSVNWRFRVPDGEDLSYRDLRLGDQRAIAGKHFGDFIVWRRDDVPAYQLAVVADDAEMGITEVVRGEDLLTSTFRQLLIYRALGLTAPQFYHAPLILDESGKRLAKRHAAMSLRALRDGGAQPEDLRLRYNSM